MFETLVAFNSLISASSRSVLLSLGSLFHAAVGVEFFSTEEFRVGNVVSETFYTAQALPQTICGDSSGWKDWVPMNNADNPSQQLLRGWHYAGQAYSSFYRYTPHTPTRQT
jgi:hypothetical protein